MSNKKIGLALGGGAARGLAHIGVLEILDREGIPIDYIAGTSSGAIIGALYAAGVKPAVIKEYVLNFDNPKRRKLLDLSLPKSGFVQGEKIIEEMKNLMGGDKTFAELNIPFACVACDIMRGEEVIIKHGSVCDGVHASIAIPILFKTVKLDGRYLVDGGLVNEVPTRVVRHLGADFVIAVNVIPRQVRRPKRKEHEDPESKPPGLMTVILNTFDIASMCRAETSIAGADMVIEPQTAGYTSTDFAEAAGLILQGEMCAIDAVLDIKRRMAQW
jgi:NTE family protein